MVVHVSGHPTIIENRNKIEVMLRRHVERYESNSQTPWEMNLPNDYLEAMIAGIVAFEVRITRIQGKFKLSQNRSPADRSNLIGALKRAGDKGAMKLADLMEQVLKP
ncbi:MAG: hypothetical protein GTO41_21055 [Burkholderiales bacterium]|nr:hypothetical protein [Burkholderiales bacterium]